MHVTRAKVLRIAMRCGFCNYANECFRLFNMGESMFSSRSQSAQSASQIAMRYRLFRTLKRRQVVFIKLCIFCV